MSGNPASQLVVAMAQINPTVGDIDGNLKIILDARAIAAASGADLMVTGELVLSGYPPEDLVLKSSFIDRLKTAVEALAAATGDGGPAVLVGVPWRDDGRLYNGAVLLDGGKIVAVRFKHDLPNYGVFDEKRVFAAGPLPDPVAFRGASLGIMVCEDMWGETVSGHLCAGGADLLIVLNGSPFEQDKAELRGQLAAARVSECGVPLIYVNLIGGQDELVFDGESFAMAADGSIRVRLPAWESRIEVTNWQKSGTVWNCDEGDVIPPVSGPEAIYSALVTGLRDYVNKNYFPGVLIGLSGGIDSALSAAIAVDALGADRVHCIMMPSPFTSKGSLDDAALCAEYLGMRLDTIAINPAMDAFDEMLREQFVRHASDTTEENIQARSRGIILMALSNKFGYMVLSTGNKSEMSVGYATLYGDMCGGYSVLKDVYKMTVYELSTWRNKNRAQGYLGPAGTVVPETIITKAPTAELKPDQTDQDSLPPYEILDAILHGLIEEELSRDEIVSRGFDAATVNKVWEMLDRAEYKRRQAPPGVKITGRAFGRDRRYPITNAFRAEP